MKHRSDFSWWAVRKIVFHHEGLKNQRTRIIIRHAWVLLLLEYVYSCTRLLSTHRTNLHTFTEICLLSLRNLKQPYNWLADPSEWIAKKHDFWCMNHWYVANTREMFSGQLNQIKDFLVGNKIHHASRLPWSSDDSGHTHKVFAFLSLKFYVVITRYLEIRTLFCQHSYFRIYLIPSIFHFASRSKENFPVGSEKPLLHIQTLVTSLCELTCMSSRTLFPRRICLYNKLLHYFHYAKSSPLTLVVWQPTNWKLNIPPLTLYLITHDMQSYTLEAWNYNYVFPRRRKYVCRESLEKHLALSFN